jgi:hypothetical protein
MINRFVLPVLLALLALATSATAKGHCTRNETVVFECSIGSRTVSVCAAQGAGASMEYRYGLPGRPEIVIPADTHAPVSAPSALVYLNPLGMGEGYLRFVRGKYSYVVYHFSSRQMHRPSDGSAPGWNNWDGILVLRGANRLTVLRCDAGGGARVEFPQDFVHGKLGFPDRVDQISNDGLLGTLLSGVIN